MMIINASLEITMAGENTKKEMNWWIKLKYRDVDVGRLFDICVFLLRFLELMPPLSVFAGTSNSK
jgi:hypothetical protein